MGFFTVGNLLTLGIVVLLLILYRHLDKRSRTLDIVSKYAEKLKEDLKAFVEEQEQVVKGYGIELKVEKESAKQLMSQVRETDGELAEKAAAAIRIEERLNVYDATLEELVRMTGRVQENLNRIRDESAFVERVEKKIGKAETRLEELEKGLGGLEGRFERENAEALENAAESVLSSVKSTVSDLEAAAETVERQVEEHRTVISKIENERAASLARDMEIVNKTLKNAVEQAGLRADRMEEAALVKLKDQAQERIRRLQAAEEERLKAYQENARSRVAEVQNLIKTLKEEWRGERQDWEAKDRSLQEECKKNIQELKALAVETEQQVSSGAGALEERLEELSAKIRTVVSEQEALLIKAVEGMKQKALEAAETRLEEYRAAQDGEFRHLEALAEDNRRLDNELRQKMMQDWEARDRSFQEGWKKDIQELKALAEETEKQVSSGAGVLEKRLEDLKAKTGTVVSEQEALLFKTVEEMNQKVLEAARIRLEEYRAAQEGEFKRLEALAEENRRLDDELRRNMLQDWEARDRSFQEGWKKDIQELKALAEETEKRVSSGAGALEERLEDLKAKTGTVVSEQEALLFKTVEGMKQKALESAETRLEEYRAAQEGEFKRLEALAEDSRRLDIELRRSMQEIAGRVKDDFSLFERESSDAREKTAAEFAAAVKSLKSSMEELEKDLNTLKASAWENVSEKLGGFVDEFAVDLAKRSGDIDRRLNEWQERIEARLGELGSQGEEKRRELEKSLTEDLRKRLTEQNERIVAELDRLKTEAAAFEESIRGRMNAADDFLLSYKDDMERNLEGARKDAELSIKSEISRYALSTADTIRQNQRDLEEKLREIGGYVESRNTELTGLMETSREHAAGLEGRIAALRSSLEETYREADSRRAEILSRSEEQVRVLDSSIRDAERHIREFFDQTKLIDQADELRVDMERRIEDLRSEIDGLDQRRAEAAQLESEFVKIRRLEDEVNAKMTRFLTEKHRMDKMEEDFARLLQTDKAVQEKLVHVTNAGDSLQEMQIKIRRIEDALAAAEEKYQRIEKKNQVLDNTNDGIDRNFKALQESEGRLQKASEELERLNGGIESIRAVIETLATENEKARETADQISLLDKALSEIEERTRAMQVAREWIARTESRMEELNRQTQEQVRLMGNILKSEGIKRGPRERGAPPVGDRENIIKLARQGWTIEEIAKNMKISQGEVELILELAPKD